VIQVTERSIADRAIFRRVVDADFRAFSGPTTLKQGEPEGRQGHDARGEAQGRPFAMRYMQPMQGQRLRLPVVTHRWWLRGVEK